MRIDGVDVIEIHRGKAPDDIVLQLSYQAPGINEALIATLQRIQKGSKLFWIYAAQNDFLKDKPFIYKQSLKVMYDKVFWFLTVAYLLEYDHFLFEHESKIKEYARGPMR
ncbi:hypothetical protein [Metabacillus sp. FJAT-52054]|uniref:Uncharacterized protein n=1 Tax=Metabacillus sediminis TaxID=3117746 RepID=A0ABZ2NMR7_9BACI